MNSFSQNLVKNTLPLALVFGAFAGCTENPNLVLMNQEQVSGERVVKGGFILPSLDSYASLDVSGDQGEQDSYFDQGYGGSHCADRGKVMSREEAGLLAVTQDYEFHQCDLEATFSHRPTSGGVLILPEGTSISELGRVNIPTPYGSIGHFPEENKVVYTQLRYGAAYDSFAVYANDEEGELNVIPVLVKLRAQHPKAQHLTVRCDPETIKCELSCGGYEMKGEGEYWTVLGFKPVRPFAPDERTRIVNDELKITFKSLRCYDGETLVEEVKNLRVGRVADLKERLQSFTKIEAPNIEIPKEKDLFEHNPQRIPCNRVCRGLNTDEETFKRISPRPADCASIEEEVGLRYKKNLFGGCQFGKDAQADFYCICRSTSWKN